MKSMPWLGKWVEESLMGGLGRRWEYRGNMTLDLLLLGLWCLWGSSCDTELGTQSYSADPTLRCPEGSRGEGWCCPWAHTWGLQTITGGRCHWIERTLMGCEEEVESTLQGRLWAES